MSVFTYKLMVYCICSVAIASADDIDEKSAPPGAIDGQNNSSLYRLPKTVVPEFYDLSLATNVTRGDFNYYGEVTILLRVLETTRRITLHADKLEVLSERSALLEDNGNGDQRTVPIESQGNNSDTQFHVITLTEDLAPGRYSLNLHFRGTVLDDAFGFYRSSYGSGNATRWIGVTQFSPTFARRAFPCWDEPGFKARFRLRVGHYANETVTSNTIPESVSATDWPDYYVTEFARTPPMSTYLLGWVIHDFHRVNFTSPSRGGGRAGIPLWTRFGDSELPGPLATLVYGPLIYSALEEYTNLTDPLQGDLVQFAIPDFNFHGMENWNLVAYRESVPLASESQAPLGLVRDALVTVAHEYAHSWWGNLVTPSFWDVAWLKEGFATYFAYVAIDAADRGWRVWEFFAVEALQTSLLADSEDHNRTMNGRDVGSPSSAKAALNFVTYKKGASIIRMIADTLGDEPFQDAMRSYLREYQYRSVVPSDLYKHLERVYQSPTAPSVADFVESWANQPNYPLVRVNRVSVRRILVTQEVFHLSRKNRSSLGADEARSWWIPVTIAAPSTKSGPLVESSSWHGQRTSVAELPDTASDDTWYVVNPRQIGYYRVDYGVGGWELLKELLSGGHLRLPRSSRAALLDDVFNLARAGYREYKLALDLAGYLRRELEYEPWVPACRAIKLLDSKLGGNPGLRLVFRSYAADLLRPIYEQVGFEERPSDSRIRRLQRNLILSTACSVNLDSCVSRAKSLFDDWIEDESKAVPANLRDFVYRVGIVNGTEDDWIELWRRFSTSDLYPEKEIMMKALARTDDSDLVRRYIEAAVRPGAADVKFQYRLSMIQWVVTGNSANIGNVLGYVDEKLMEIIRLRDFKFLGDIFTTIGKEVTSNEQLDELTSFVNKNAGQLGSAFEAGKKAIKQANDNLVWINDCVLQIANYFN